jgi:NAD(P)-dependent dehydrogenase (short-subunit alcohol dehydrogenase family)
MLNGFPGIDDVRTNGTGIPLGRLAHVDEVARLVVWIASDNASYTTGSELVVDGGVLAL